ncbi:MAG TPA: NADH-quinone oxidoreductase subunit D, partial [Gemmatales bacterium]|nr:NADH-quinone oxidoreductase subunit D [Gemmatales bacterium]
TDRMDYIAAMNMNLGYSLAIEKLCGMKIPAKAQVIRVLVSELNRIASHLLGMGAYGIDLGSFTPFLYAFREREKILTLFEELCGARLTYSYVTIGGVHDDLPEGWIVRCRAFLDEFLPHVEEYHTLLTRNHIFIQRTCGLGVLSKALALAYGCTGPVLRGSLDSRQHDPAWDLRKLEPYTGYETYEFDAIIPPFREAPREAVLGDNWHRYYVRMLEVMQSVKIIRQALDRYPQAEGSHRIEPPRYLSGGECYVETECPRGQMGFYVVGRPARDGVPLRVRARSSCMANLSVIHELCRGCLIADIPAILGSLDIMMGEIDR